ncbi:hypothetical protein ACZ91_52050 [Streptomyces regensis]|nr:hypothetical protein ACZ91_52050 [Streptomyces regensis]
MGADRQMPAHVRQQGAAAPDGDVEEPVVVAAFLGGREFPVGTYATGPELFARLLEGGCRGGCVDPRQTGGYVYGFGFDLGVPEKALRGAGKGPECAGGELSVFRRPGLCGAQPAPTGGFTQFRQGDTGHLVRGPGADGVADGDQKSRAQGAAGRTAEHLVEGGGGHHMGAGTGGG